MRAKLAERQQAVALRQQGLSYSEIQTRVPVTQASLSLWLRHIELSPHQRLRLEQKKLANSGMGGKKAHEAKLARVERIRLEADREARTLYDVNDPLWIVGTVLYWAEGSKVRPWSGKEQVSITNMDPTVIRIFRGWLLKYCSIGSQDLEYALCIHPSANVTEARDTWAKTLEVRTTALRVYYKRHNPRPRRKNTGRTYHGTMRLSVARSTALLYRIDQWIRVLAERCGVG